jgi:ribosomal protein S18 acetylase RimI-like enzyme
MIAKVKVRPYESRDHAAVVALWSDIFADDPPWNEPAAMIRRKLTVQPELFLVACLDGQVVGTVMAGFDGVRGWIHHLAVHNSYRRQGIASVLMRAAEQGLGTAGCPKVNLQVRATNGAVIAFYRSLGYEVEERASLGKRLEAASHRVHPIPGREGTPELRGGSSSAHAPQAVQQLKEDPRPC